jgi:hypothetical protein
MLDPQLINKIGATIRAASASTEAKFVKIGQRPESSVGILGKVATTPENLSGELKSENLQRTTDDLSRAAAQVAAIGRAHRGEQTLRGPRRRADIPPGSVGESSPGGCGVPSRTADQVNSWKCCGSSTTGSFVRSLGISALMRFCVSVSSAARRSPRARGAA